MAAKPQEKPGGAASAIAGFIIVSVLTGGIGAGAGVFLSDTGPRDAAHTGGASTHQPRPPAAPAHKIMAVPPILTTLLAPANTFIRLEAALIADFDTPNLDSLGAKVGEDFIGYLRSVALKHIEGPSGFQHLRGDLLERAQQRSNGKIRDIAIQTLVIE